MQKSTRRALQALILILSFAIGSYSLYYWHAVEGLQLEIIHTIYLIVVFVAFPSVLIAVWESDSLSD